jgi:hypothetical protein
MRKLWILGALALLAACSDDSGREQGSFSPTGITGVGVTGDLDESTGDFDQTAGGTGPKLDVEAMSAGDEGGGPGNCESLVD